MAVHRLLTPPPTGMDMIHSDTEGAFFWDYSGIGILGIDGICVLLGDVPFSE